MARLKNISGNHVDLFAQAGEADSYAVDADAVVTVPGDVANSDDEDADFYEIGTGDQMRHWPKSAWSLVTDSPPAKRAAPAKTDESGE